VLPQNQYFYAIQGYKYGIVQEMTDDQAVIIMVDSNLHREETLPSEVHCQLLR